MNRVAVIDYGMGNLRSVAKAFEHLGADVIVTSSPADLHSAHRIVYPGVGSFAECARRMHESGFHDAVRAAVLEDGVPLLGICLGMQGLVDRGDEGGESQGLGLIPGEIVKFDLPGMKVPHVGWNEVDVKVDHPLFSGIEPGACFYFVHSYHVVAPQFTVATTDYGGPFSAAIAKDNVFGIQCHPEKSQVPGLKLLSNFLSWSPG